MSLKLSKKSEIRKILLISLTNIGDVILTFPVIDILKRDFPSAKLSVVVGPKAATLLKENPCLDKIHVFDKRQSSFKSLSWIRELRKERFDLAVDLRNTAIPLLIAARYRTSLRVRKIPNQHMREKHINRLRPVYAVSPEPAEPCAVFIPSGDAAYVDQLIEKEIGRERRFVMIAPGAADQSKRWPNEKFAAVCERLINDYQLKIIFVGSEEDRKTAQQINKLMEHEAVNLCGMTTLVQLAQLFKHCFFSIVNDSAPMHLASYFNAPVLALFGPTDPFQYGPWSRQSCFLRKNAACQACANPKALIEHTCMSAITSEDVLKRLQINLSDNRIHFPK